MGLRITLVGSVAIEYGDGPSRYLNSAQAQVALARLTIERREGTTRDQLADTLWPDGLPNTWSSALRSVVSRVRAFVAAALPPGPTPLESLGGRYLLHLPDDTEVDLEAAESAVAAAREASGADPAAARRLAGSAAACLRAPFLPDHDGEWVAGVRHQMAELLVASLEIASYAASGLGDHGGALAYADEAISRAPLRESAYRCRMTAHARGGNRAEALRTYQHVRRVLAEEVGVDPAPETESAYLDLLGVPSPGPVGVARDRPPPLAPFVGREAELAALAGAWARAAGGAAHMVLLTGESGVGKSRLATEAARRVVEEGGLALTGRCEQPPAVSCQPFVEAVGGYLAATPADSLPRFGADTLRRLAPVLPVPGGGLRLVTGDAGGGDDERDGGCSDVGAPGDGEARLPAPDGPAWASDLVEPLGDVVLRLSTGRHLLVLIDDLHAADDDTFRLLRWLSRRAAGRSVLVLATSDDGRGGGRFTRAAHDLDRDGWLHRLALRGLDEPEIRALTRRALPDVPRDARPPAHVLFADTAGNAFLLLELLRWHAEQDAAGVGAGGGGLGGEAAMLPSGIHDYAAAQLGSLDRQQRDLLRAAAVAGAIFELTPAADAAGLMPGPALDALEALMATGVVAEAAYRGAPGEAQRYRFTHDVVRRALYEQLSDARRRELHTRMADAVEQHCPIERGHYVRLLAEHRAAGAAPGGDRRAVRWGWRAAARAVQDGNAAEAVEMHRRVLDHIPPGDDALRAEALTLLGLAQSQAGQPGAAHTLLDAAIAARRCDRVDIAGRAVLGLADAAGARLRPEAVALVDEVVTAASAGRVGPRAGEGAIEPVTFARLVARQAQAEHRPVAAAATLAMRVLASELMLLVGPVDPARRRTLATELLAVAAAAGDAGHQVVAAHHQATAADMEGDPAARDEALAVMAGALGGGDLAGDALLADHAVALAVTQGRFTDAAATARLAAELASERFDRILPTPGTLAGRQVLVGGWLRGGSWLADHAADARPRGHAEEILLALARGDRGWAHVALRALATGAEPLPPDDEWSHVAGLLGLVAVEVGDPTTAEAVRRLLAPYTDLACGVGYRSYVGPVAFHLGRLAVMAGDWADAERHLTASLRRLASRQARPWIALTQTALAQALDGRGRPADRRWAAALRADARSTAHALGLQPERLAASG